MFFIPLFKSLSKNEWFCLEIKYEKIKWFGEITLLEEFERIIFITYTYYNFFFPSILYNLIIPFR